MNNAQTYPGDPPSRPPRKPIRVWPGVLLAIVLLVLRFVLPLVSPESAGPAMIGVAVVALLIFLWWMLFSRVPHPERWGGLALLIVALPITFRLSDTSIRGGAMGFLFPILSVPTVALALVAWAVLARRLSTAPRRGAMVALILVACGFWALVRTGGMTGDAGMDFHWRWTATPEERLLAVSGERPAGLASAVDAAEAVWPGFRGPLRDGIVRGARIGTDWTASPPVQMWRKPIGPGWSSFAVQGDFFFTQEQRGDDEVVSCYSLATGEPVWRHTDATRFYESNAGPGPRATPTLAHGRVYTLGATGIVNALDARDGSLVWSRHAEKDTEAKMPGWGFAGSPLVLDEVVVVATAGRMAGYDPVSGQPRWLGPKGGSGYSSPHLLTIGGVPQVLLMSMSGVASVSPPDGAVLWQHAWKGDGIVQPALTADGDLLLGSGSGLSEVGMRRLGVAHGDGGWKVEERWTSMNLKPYFNDFVVHEGHAYGFDGGILSCIRLEDGERVWKGGRYGHGQLLLLPEQDLLLVLSEQGELALVGAVPDQFTERARHPAIQGKTWNHPVLAGDVLLVRNGEEMAAFRLPLEK